MTGSSRRLLDHLWRAGTAPASAVIIAVLIISGLIVVLIILGLVAVAPVASAQDVKLLSLIDRVERLQRDLTDLQRQVYRGELPKAPAPGVGPSTDRRAMSNTAAARIERRLSQFESELRGLTGQVEEAVFLHNQLRLRLDKLAARLDRQFAQVAPATAAPGIAPPDPRRRRAPSIGRTRHQGSFGAGPRVLGTIDSADLEALQTERVEVKSAPTGSGSNQGRLQAGAQQTARLGYVLPGKTPDAQYKYAFGLLSQAAYAEAELALRSFVEQNPTNPLAGNAKYWLGETYYVRQDYQQAAITFAEAFQAYPDSPKAPDNLLKLGMSLAALGTNQDACGTFAELLKRYPEAAKTVTQRAKQERQRLACL